MELGGSLEEDWEQMTRQLALDEGGWGKAGEVDAMTDTKWDPDAGPSLRTRVGHDSQEPRGKPLAERAARAWTPTLGRQTAGKEADG